MAVISIIITTHDRPSLLRRAIESAQRAASEIEVVVVDDGSIDETPDVCASFPGVKCIRLEKRRGVGYARSVGLAASSGEYVSFLDDDDARLPGSIDEQIAVLEASPDAALVYGQIHRATQTLELRGRRPRVCPTGDIFWQLMSSNFIATCTVVVRRSAIEAVGGLASECAPAEDWDLWLRITERFPVAALPRPVAIYREPTLWSHQGSSRLAEGLFAADLRVLERCANLPRANADPRAYRVASRRVKSLMCLRLVAETVEAAWRMDAYALVSFRHAAATPAAFARGVLSPFAWKKLRERLQS